MARRGGAFASILVRDMRHLAFVDVDLLRAVDLFRLLGVGGGAISINEPVDEGLLSLWENLRRRRRQVGGVDCRLGWECLCAR